MVSPADHVPAWVAPRGQALPVLRVQALQQQHPSDPVLPAEAQGQVLPAEVLRQVLQERYAQVLRQAVAVRQVLPVSSVPVVEPASRASHAQVSRF